jgi:hypothetical protein
MESLGISVGNLNSRYINICISAFGQLPVMLINIRIFKDGKRNRKEPAYALYEAESIEGQSLKA